MTAMEDEELIQQIEKVLDKIRPFLRREGGDIDLVGYRDGVVYVSMVGACQGCMYADDDISTGVEIILMEEVPGIIRVEAHDFPPDILQAYIDKKKQADENK